MSRGERRRESEVHALRAAAALLAALAIALPVLVFTTASLDSFVPPKLYLFHCLGAFSLTLSALALRRAVLIPIRDADLLLSLVFLLVFLSPATARDPILASESAWQLLPALGLYLVLRQGEERAWLLTERLLGIVLVPVLTYALLQWIGWDPFFVVPEYFAHSRIFSTLGNRNQLAYFLGAFLLVRLRRPAAVRPAAFLLSSLTAGVFLLLATRGAWLAFLPALVLRGWQQRFCAYSPRFRRRMVLMTLIALTLLFIGRSFAWNPSPVSELRRLTAQDPNVAMRLELYRAALHALGHFPLYGIGAGGFAPHHAAVLDGPEFRVHASRTHNEYLQAGAELGLPGLFALTALVLLVCLRLRQDRAGGPAALFLALAALWSFPFQTAASGPLFLLLVARAAAASPVRFRWCPRPFDRRLLIVFLPALALLLLLSAPPRLASAVFLRQADRAARLGGFEAAGSLLYFAVRLDGRNEVAAFRRAGWLLDRNDPAGAEALLKTIRRRREDPAVLRARAECRLRQGDGSGAERLLQHALARGADADRLQPALQRARALIPPADGKSPDKKNPRSAPGESQ